MTNVGITMREGHAKIRISGHAGYGYANGLPEGHDIVCAAISVLGQTLVQRIMGMAEENKLVLNLIKFEPGEIKLTALAKSGSAEELETTLKAIAEGFRLLSSEYPDHVRGGCWIRGKKSGMVYTWDNNDTRERPWKGAEKNEEIKTGSENV